MPCCGARWLPAAGRLVPCAARRALRARLRCSVLVCPPRRRHRAPRDGPSPREQRFVLGGNDGRGSLYGERCRPPDAGGNAGPHGWDCARARVPRRPTALHAGPWVRRCLPRPVAACGREVPPRRAARCGRGCLELKPDVGAAVQGRHTSVPGGTSRGGPTAGPASPHGRSLQVGIAALHGGRGWGGGCRVPLQPAGAARGPPLGPARCGRARRCGGRLTSRW